jgi:DNA invertase Pin-like site-specific DNA recombinase
MTPSRRAVIYTRVSRDDTGEGRSNQRQEADCRTLAKLRGWQIVAVVEDISVSAYSGKKREGWQRVTEMMRSGQVDIVLAWNLDRITRTVRELTDIIALCRETDVGIATVNGDIDLSNDTGKMVATILGAVAEAEVERKGARQKAANAQRRAEGKRWAAGWRPFGYQLDGTIVPEEAVLIREAADQVLRGVPLREIARRWREAGVSTPRSERGAEGWTHHGVKSILMNPRNAGLNTYKGEIVGKGDWEPIIDPNTHTLLVAFLANPQRKTTGANGRIPANLLSGLAVCATCGEKVQGGTVGRTTMVDGRRVATGRRVPVYKCPNNHLSTDRADADRLVVHSFAMAVRFSTQSMQLMPVDLAGNDPDALLQEAEHIRANLTRLSESFAADRITIDQLEAASDPLRARLAEVEHRLSERGSLDAAQVRSLISANMDRFMDMDVREQRAILARCARITLYPKGRGKKKVPIKHQVTMDLVTYDSRGQERIIPALRERPRTVTPVNTTPQRRARAR